MSSDIVCLTETWLNLSFLNSELFSKDFNVFRKDRFDTVDGEVGGGVLIAVNINFTSSIFPIPFSEGIELLCVKIALNKSFVYIINTYIPPASTELVYQSVLKSIDYVVGFLESRDEIIVMGDFNLPEVSWVLSDNKMSLNGHTSINKNQDFLDSINSDLQQISCIKNRFEKQLDLVFSTDYSKVVVLESKVELSKIDNYHPPLDIFYQVDDDCIDSLMGEQCYFDFKKTDYNLLNSLIDEHYNDIVNCLRTNTLDNTVEYFYNILFKCMCQAVPIACRRNLSTFYPWYNNNLKSLRNVRNKCWNKYVLSQNTSDLNKYKMAEESFKVLNSQLYKKYLDNTNLRLLFDPKHFWKFINIKKKSDGYPSSFIDNSRIIKDPEIISGLFADLFKNCFATDDFIPDLNFFQYLNSGPNINMGAILIDRVDILQALTCLDDDNSSGPDGIPPIILKNCSYSISKLLTLLFERSLSEGYFPKIWKISFISPIFKKGCNKEISNYRPIAKLSSIPKVFERLVYDIIKHDCYRIISSRQHGFVKGRSTTSNLLEFTIFFYLLLIKKIR